MNEEVFTKDSAFYVLFFYFPFSVINIIDVLLFLQRPVSLFGTILTSQYLITPSNQAQQTR